MTFPKQNIQEVATQLLAGMLANPHIYARVSDAEAGGQQERILVSNAVTMAQSLVEKIEQSDDD